MRGSYLHLISNTALHITSLSSFVPLELRTRARLPSVLQGHPWRTLPAFVKQVLEQLWETLDFANCKETSTNYQYIRHRQIHTGFWYFKYHSFIGKEDNFFLIAPPEYYWPLLHVCRFLYSRNNKVTGQTICFQTYVKFLESRKIRIVAGRRFWRFLLVNQLPLSIIAVHAQYHATAPLREDIKELHIQLFLDYYSTNGIAVATSSKNY